METLEIIKVVSELGSVAMLLYFLSVIWKDKQVKEKNKDNRIKELSDSLLEAFVDNTKVQGELRNAIAENTRASRTLTERVREVLSKGREE